MVEKLQQIPTRLLEWWNKFSSKQKTIIISVAAGVILTFAILITMLTRPQFETLVVCESTKQAAQVKELLEEDGIQYNMTDDGLTFTVKKQDLSDATILLGASDIPTAGYGIENVVNAGFSATEADKSKSYKLYLESYMEQMLEGQDPVDEAFVQFYIPDNDGTLLSTKEDSYASVVLTLAYEIEPEIAKNYAKMIKEALGNDNTDNITILDSYGNLLFSGGDDSSPVSNATNQLALKQQAEQQVKQNVEQAILGTSLYENVKVTPNLVMDFTETERTNHNYSAPDGRTEGMIINENTYTAEGSGGVAGVPGTDANQEETYVLPDEEGSTYSVEQSDVSRAPNEEITSTKIPPGLIQYEQSSISVVANHYVFYREEDLQEQGLLDGMTFSEFENANSERVKTEVDADLYTAVAMATGIAEENISIIAYDVPFFQPREGSSIQASDIMQILLIVLILGLLGFVVFASMRTPKAAQVEEELSVESLLQTTQDNQLNEIDADAKSEERKLIEKFVDDNPEAAASLLRNWLQEDWG